MARGVGQIAGDTSTSRLLSAATTNATVIKAAPGVVHGYYIYNANAAVRYVKLYDVAAGTVVVGTTVPKVTLPIPAGAAANLYMVDGIAFVSGIGLAITTGFADADTAAVAAGEIIVNIFYK